MHGEGQDSARIIFVLNLKKAKEPCGARSECHLHLKKLLQQLDEQKFGRPFENRAAEVLVCLVELYIFHKAVYYLICCVTVVDRIFSFCP